MKRKAVHLEGGNLWVRGPLVGKGSCGSVYLGISKDYDILPTVMAVKSARIYDAGSLQKEGKILGKFEGCPGIIQCYGEVITVGEDGERIYNLLLEYAHDGTLGDLIDKNGDCGLPEPDVRFYTRCILEGLSEIHQFGYVHCDIKPENILMATAGLFDATNHVAKIGDFGMVKKADKKTSTRGSPMYVSPEVVKFRIQEPPSDIWALGCVVLKMLTGKRPWVLSTGPNKDQDSVMMDLLSMIGSADESPAIPSNISEEGKDFLRCCFARNPARRSMASELLNHKFVIAFKEKGQEKGNEGEEVLDAEGVNSPSSTTYEDSSVTLDGSSGSSALGDTDQVPSSGIVPNVFPKSTNTVVI